MGLAFTQPEGILGEFAEANPSIDSERWIEISELARGARMTEGMVLKSAVLQQSLVSLARLAPHKATVLVNGESGVGKDLIARLLHAWGPTPQGPFVTFNCSNLVESLAESQLFGHIRGAFTDAREDSLGYFRAADGGTLFLDEIGDLPLALQPKLLRAVELLEIQPLGSSRRHKVDVRLVAATNRDLRAMVKIGRFRADLFYRLSAASVTIPPLRDRPEDIAPLIAHFIGECNRAHGTSVTHVSARALNALESRTWPGNIRELANLIQAAALLAEGTRIDLSHIPGPDPGEPAETGDAHADIVSQVPRFVAAHQPRWHSLEEVKERAAKGALLSALRYTRGNCERAAQLLNVSRYTVYRMVARYNLMPVCIQLRAAEDFSRVPH